jgi:hypothetical protein
VEADASAALVVLDLARQLELPRSGIRWRPCDGAAAGHQQSHRPQRRPQGVAFVRAQCDRDRQCRNDHAMLTACEVGVAVNWGKQALCAVADEILERDGPPAVARKTAAGREFACARRESAPPVAWRLGVRPAGRVRRRQPGAGCDWLCERTPRWRAESTRGTQKRWYRRARHGRDIRDRRPVGTTV